jgi:hypothetical protein
MRKIAACSIFFAFLILAISAPAFGQVAVSVRFGPPALPVYVQPVCPGDGYMWTPGYWAWDDVDGDYYWVPGTWVEPPEVGLFWTPGWWGWGGDAFIFHEGYWGPTVGFYGGINYGFGFFGVGFVGGHWDGGHFFYNRAVANVNVNIVHNVYNERVTNETVNRVSFNGGNGGLTARPTPQEEAAANERHIPPVGAQTQQVQAARENRDLRASVNHGKPPIAATPRPGAFTDHEVVKAKEAGAPYTPPADRGATAARADANAGASANAGAPAKAIVHPRDLPPAERPTAPNSGNADLDKKYQQQQDKLMAQQQQERQKLQQQQDKEHQQLAKQKADDQRTQQLEQKHQQQTQQMAQRHTQEQQDLQRRQAPPAPRESEGRPR